MTLGNSLAPDQPWLIVGSDLDPKPFDTLTVFLQEFHKKMIWKNWETTKKHVKLSSMQRVNWSSLIYSDIFTFPLRVFKWTFTFEMWLIHSWTNRFKPHPHMPHLSRLTSSPSNNVACLLMFAWRWTRIVMTLSTINWRFGYSKPFVMSDLIQNIWKTSQVRWKLKIDTWLII